MVEFELLEKLMARMSDPDERGCRVWLGTRISSGYGSVSCKGGPKYTHRVAYEAFVGPLKPKMHIDHLCRNIACCNPWHLEQVTCRENMLRSKRHESMFCKRGHPRTPANKYTRPNGASFCVPCERSRHKAQQYFKRQKYKDSERQRHLERRLRKLAEG